MGTKWGRNGDGVGSGVGGGSPLPPAGQKPDPTSPGSRGGGPGKEAGNPQPPPRAARLAPCQRASASPFPALFGSESFAQGAQPRCRVPTDLGSPCPQMAHRGGIRGDRAGCLDVTAGTFIQGLQPSDGKVSPGPEKTLGLGAGFRPAGCTPPPSRSSPGQIHVFFLKL